jgi:integrase/ribosomal protein L37AE/L43A
MADKPKTRDGVRKRGDPGSWEVILYLGQQAAYRCDDCNRRFWARDHKGLTKCSKCGGALHPTTEKRQIARGGYRTQAEAKAARAAMVTKTNEGHYVHSGRLTLGDFLVKTWLPAIRTTVRPSTLNSYTCHVNKHIVPELGTKRLRDLSGEMINDFYAKLAESGKLIGEEDGLAPASVRRMHCTLHRALRDAVRWDHLSRNPADAADPPKASAEKDTLHFWSQKQLGAFLGSVQDDRLYHLWAFLVATGVRRGEALGLQWGDVDLAANTVSIRRSLVPVSGKVIVSDPKTKKGRRTLHIGPETRRVLQEQAARQGDDSDKLGEAWQASGYVFTTEDGRPLNPGRVSLLFLRAVTAAALPRITVHDLRHTYATIALKAGVHPKVVQEALGHSTVAITIDIYSHAVEGMAPEAAQLTDALVFARS